MSLKKEMIHGVLWSAVEKYSSLVVSIVVSMILARILSPKEYGVVAIATVIICFLQMFCTMGIGPAVIQRRDLTDKDLNSIFTFSLLLGIILSAIFFCSSWFIADYYGNQQLLPVCQILTVQLLFAAANMVPNALMSKAKRFKDIARRTLTLHIISGTLSVLAALHGAGVYALLISPVISSIGIFLWNRMYFKVSIDWGLNMEPLKRIFGFSSYQFLFEFINYFSRNLDKLIIGKFMSLDSLGIYEKSYRLMQMPMNNITSVINPVMLPVLNGLQDDKQDLAKKYAKVVRFIATISFPLGVLLWGVAREAIHIFYGGKWDAAIPVFSILALSLPLQMILSTSGAIYMVCNNTKMQFWLGIRNTVTTVLGFLIAAIFWGSIEAMAWAWTITLIINFFCTYWLMYRYVLCASLRSMLRVLREPLVSALCVGGLLLVLNACDIRGGWVVSLMVKALSSLLIVSIIIQISGQYNLIAIIRTRATNHITKSINRDGHD